MRRWGFAVGMSERAGSTSTASKLPTLRLRPKIILGFAVTLAISAASMGIAYLGFERVAAGVATYRHSVSEADLARNIDRELISYRSLARYFVVTGKEEDGKAALAAEAGLKDAIDQSMKGTTNPARRDQVARLDKEFQNFSKIFAEILRIKQESALLTQNQLMRSGNMLRYKLDDLPEQRRRRRTAIGPVRRQGRHRQFQAATALANTFVVNSDQTTAANSALARLKFVENSLKAISTTNPEDRRRPQGGCRRCSSEYKQVADQADRQFEIDRRTNGEDDRVGDRDHAGRGHLEGGPGVRSATTRIRDQRADRRDRAPDSDACGRRLPARRRCGRCCWAGEFPGR